MRKFVLLASLLSCFSSAGFALTLQEPIEGFASIISEQWVTGTGNIEFSIKCPKGWGIGDTSVSENGDSSFLLLPIDGGYGCTIEAKYYNNEEDVVTQLGRYKKAAGNIKKVKGGFEVSFLNGWYLCRKQGNHLVQIWYTKPRVDRQDILFWDQFRECFNILNKYVSNPSKKVYSRLTPDAHMGWWCHHPLKPVDVLFETTPTTKVIPNQGGARSHLLQYSETKSSGYFFVKWNAGVTDGAKTYQDHLKQMMDEVKKMEPDQKNNGAPEFHLDNRYALQNGNPYQFITLAGDGFLYGFAYKTTSPYQKLDLNDFVKRVKWKSTKASNKKSG